MHAVPLEAHRGQSRSHRRGSEAWNLAAVHTFDDMSTLIETVADEMAREGYPDKDQFSMRLSLEEAIVNAVKHGHDGDPNLAVQVRYRVSFGRVLVEVEDEGPGFDPYQVDDPFDPENLTRPCGRGLFLMRHYMTWIHFNERGNAVLLCKCRTAVEG